MGTLISNPAVRASFEQKLYPAGIDLNTSDIRRALGVWRASAGTSFRAGQGVMLNSSGEVVLYDGNSRLLGVAKWNKITTKRTVVVDQIITFGTAGAVKNLKPNIIGAATTFSVQVRSAASGGGTLYTDTADGASGDDYTVNYVNGTITHIASGSGGDIDPTLPVYVTYARSLTEYELELEGKNFWQSLDEVTIQDLRITVIEPPAQIFTTEFDVGKVYAYGVSIYMGTDGLFTSTASSNKLVGTCIGVPTSGSPYLGVDFFGQVST